jgi:uncharacterized protein YpuA (DUF1002 family)
MMAPALARARVPRARIVVTTTGNCTGTAAMAKATAASDGKVTKADRPAHCRREPLVIK